MTGHGFPDIVHKVGKLPDLKHLLVSQARQLVVELCLSVLQLWLDQISNIRAGYRISVTTNLKFLFKKI